MRNTVIQIGLTNHHVIAFVRDTNDGYIIGLFTQRLHDSGYSLVLTRDLSREITERIPGDVKYTDMLPSSRNRVINWIMGNAIISEIANIYISVDDGFIANVETAERLVAEPNFPPYKPGTLVFDVKTRTNNLSTALFPQDALGKIISYETGNKTYKYTVQFMDQGLKIRTHELLLPVENFFDKYDSAAYTATEDCNNLFFRGERFLLRDNYLYNRDQTVVLSYNKFKNLFNHIANATVQTSDINA